MTKIAPEFAVLYDYIIEQDDSTVSVRIRYPAGFDDSQIQVSQTDSQTGLTVSLPPPHPPVIRCSLFGAVTSISTSSSAGELLIRLTKSSSDSWPHLASGFFPETEDIDPKSAFLLSRAKADPGEAQAFVEIAATSGYVPAIRYLIESSEDQTRLPRSIRQLLELAAEAYKDPASMLTLGRLIEADSPAAAYTLYEEAFAKGLPEAGLAMAILKSPLAASAGVAKDAKEAVRLLEAVVAVQENPTALHELAKLLHNGVGVAMDRKKAAEMQTRAEAAGRDVPPVETIAQRDWIAVGFAAAGVLLAGFVIASIWRRPR
jgi:hypothetical protein